MAVIPVRNKVRVVLTSRWIEEPGTLKSSTTER